MRKDELARIWKQCFQRRKWKLFLEWRKWKLMKKKSCTSLFLVLKTRKIEKKIPIFLFEFFYQLFFVSKILYFLSRKRKKTVTFSFDSIFSNPVERFRGPTIQRMFVVRLYSKLIVLGFAQCLLGQLYAFCLAIQTGGRQRFWLFVLLGFQ